MKFSYFLPLILMAGCSGCEDKASVQTQSREYTTVDCPADFELELTDEEKINARDLYKVLVITGDTYVQSVPSFMIDFSNGLKAKGWHVFDAAKMKTSIREDLFLATGKNRYPDIIVLYNAEESMLQKWNDFGSKEMKNSVVINWVDEVHAKNIVDGMKAFQNIVDAIFPRYPHAALRAIEPAQARCFQMSHAATENFFRPIDETKKEETVLLSGSINPSRFYLLRNEASRLRHVLLGKDGKEIIVTRTHPGYDFMPDPEKEAKEYAEEISKHLLAISGAGLEPALPGPFIYAKHFEIPAAGTALITDEEVKPYLEELGFIAGHNYIATSREKLAETIKHWLDPQNRAELLEITKRGQDLVHDKHQNKFRIESFDRIAVNLFIEKNRPGAQNITHDSIGGNGTGIVREFYNQVFKNEKNRPSVAVYSHWDEIPSADFKGVHVFLDGESTGPQNKHRTYLDRMLYIGPRTDTGAKQSIYLPFASLHFAERKVANPLDLLSPGATRASGKKYFAAYLASNCVAFREDLYNRLVRLARTYNLGPVHALSHCHGKHPETKFEIPKERRRGNLNYLDTAVEIFKDYEFVLTSENEIVDGYVTEKPISALLAGAIPIYVGTKDILTKGFLNPESFLFINHENSFQSFEAQVLEAATNAEKRNKLLNAAPVDVDQLYLYSWHNDVIKKIRGHGKSSVQEQVLAKVREIAFPVPDGKKVHFITYANHVYENSRKRIMNEAAESGWFASIEGHSPSTIQEFRNLHSNFIRDNNRGGGYWIWKPYMLLRKLESMQDGDYLVYLDAGCSINHDSGSKRFQQYLETLANSKASVFGFELEHHPEKCWSKADLFEAIGSRMNQEIADSGQRISGIIIFKKTPEAVDFVKEWLTLMLDQSYHLVDDSPSVLPNDVCYSEHRHDQSIYSVLSKSYGMLAIPDETYPPEQGYNRGWPFLATRKR